MSTNIKEFFESGNFKVVYFGNWGLMEKGESLIHRKNQDICSFDTSYEENDEWIKYEYHMTNGIIYQIKYWKRDKNIITFKTLGGIKTFYELEGHI